MPTQCNTKPLEFEPHGRRRVVADFDGGPITSDAGALLLRRVDRLLALSDQVAACFTDHRDPKRTQYSLRTLIAQRIRGIALGYEDLNDHDQLRHDPVMALLSEKGRRPDSPPWQAKAPSTDSNTPPPKAPAATTRSTTTPRPYKPCWSRCSSKPTLNPPMRSPSTSTPPTIPSTGNKRTASSTATTTPIAICPSTSSRAAICSRPCSDPPTSMLPPALWSRSSASSPACGGSGLRSRSCCGPTPDLPVKR